MSRRASRPPKHATNSIDGEKTCGRADADEGVRSGKSGKPLQIFMLEPLYGKRKSEREEALASIIERLIHNLSNNLLEDKFATFLFRFLNSVKIGSTKEVNYSFQAIGLMATIVNSEDKLSELYRELLPVLSGALKSGPTTLKILDCLAIVSFFGAINCEETESAMSIIWNYINPESGYDVTTKNNSAEFLVAGIYSWLFLLSSRDGIRLNYTYWKGAISYFTDLLDHDNNIVCGAASEALALIFETGSLEKFWNDEDGSNPTYSQIQQSLSAHILKKVNCAYLKVRSEKNAGIVRNVVRYFESSHVPEESFVVKKKALTFSSWHQIIQLQFLKRFLADGFKKHMEENEKLQNLFEFNPHKRYNGPELYVSTTEKISVTFFMPGDRDQYMRTKEQRKKERVWRNCIYEKAKTQLMTKHRLLSQELNSVAYDE